MTRTSLPTFLAAVMLTVLVAGCTTGTDTTATGDNASSVAVDAAAGTVPAGQNEGIYADGTYNATGNYTSPAGAEEMDISLTLDGGVVTDATFMGKAVNPVSKTRQDAFADGFKELVVGKSIDEIELTKVNGSSLVPKGFMEAVAKIKAEAQAAS